MKKNAQKIISLGLAGAMMTTMFAGCSRAKTLSKNALPKQSQVMLIDDEQIIVEPKGYFNATKFGYICDSDTSSHYVDVITKTHYHVIDFTSSEIMSRKNENGEYIYPSLDAARSALKCKDRRAVTLFKDEAILLPLTSKLNEEQLQKIAKNNFTDNDLVELQSELNEQGNSKTLDKKLD